MSGFEVAGVILGAIPLLISALEHYRSGKGAASSFIKFHGHLDTLIFRLKLQQTFFYLDILELLRVANVGELGRSGDPTEELCHVILGKADTARTIASFLGPLYEIFLEILGRYEACLKTIAGRLGHLMRLPDVRTCPPARETWPKLMLSQAQRDDLQAILQANRQQDRRFAFKERLSFTLERGRLKALLEELREDRLSLKVIIKRVTVQRRHASREPGHDAAAMARQLSGVREAAGSLFSALCRDDLACKCQTQHIPLVKLESRVLNRALDERKLLSSTEFSLVITLERAIFPQALGSAIDEEDENPVDADHYPASVLAAKSLGSAANTILTPVLDTGLPENRSLCHSARKCWKSGHILRLQLDADALTVSGETWAFQELIMRSITAKLPLEKFLSHSRHRGAVRLTPKQQTLFALDVASSVLQHSQTRWLTAPWSSRDIQLITSTDHRGRSILASPIVGVFVQKGVRQPAPQLLLSPSSGQTANSPPGPHDVLLELAILLLEIWNHYPLMVWADNNKVETRTPDQRRIAVMRWLQSTSDNLPLDYLTAVEQCLAISSGRLRDWDDERFQIFYCENIIKPLVDACKTWVVELR